MTLGPSVFVPKWLSRDSQSHLHTLLRPHWISHQSTYTPCALPPPCLVLPGHTLSSLSARPTSSRINLSLLWSPAQSCARCLLLWPQHLVLQLLSGVVLGNALGFFKLFFSLLKCSWRSTLCQFQVYYMVIWHLHTLWNDHHNKSSKHLSPYEVITLVLTAFLMLYITSPWLTYFITGGLSLLIPFTYFPQHPPPILCIYESFCFVSCFRFHIGNILFVSVPWVPSLDH